MALTDPTPSGPRKGPSPHRTLDQARAGAEAKVLQAQRALAELERRHERAADRVEKLSRRRQALDLELADAESERDRTESRLSSTRTALAAAEQRLANLGDA